MPFAGQAEQKAKFPRVDGIQPIEAAGGGGSPILEKMKADREAGLVEIGHPSAQRTSGLWWFGGGLLAAAAVLASGLAVVLHRIEPYLRAQDCGGVSQHSTPGWSGRPSCGAAKWALGEGRGPRIWPPAEWRAVECAGTGVGPAKPFDPAGRVQVPGRRAF